MLPRILSYAATAIGNYRITSQELRSLQDKKVRRLVAYCFAYIPYYHKRFREIGIRPSDFRGVADLAKFPTLTRGQLEENYPRGITVSPQGTGLTLRTTGTTGNRQEIRWDAKFCDLEMAAHIRRMTVQGLRFWNKVAEIITSTTREVGTPIRSRRPSLALTNALFGSFHVRYPTLRRRVYRLARVNERAVAGALLEYNPDILYARPSHARRLGNALASMGKRITPRLVVCSGEFLSSAVRREIEDGFGARVLNQYGSVEMGTIGFECMKGQGMHVNSDMLVLETQEGGEPAGPGRPGNVLLTNLENRAMPLVRYQIGDVAILDTEERCECGSSFPRIGEVLGRSNEGLVTSDGERIPVGAVCDEFETEMGMRDFQLTQRSLTRYNVKLRPSDNNRQKVEHITAYLTSVIGADLDLEVTEWVGEDMPPKYRPVISEVE